MWTGYNKWENPKVVLEGATDQRDVVRGLIPSSGITWMYGASMSFKTFVAMSIATAVSRGTDWVGRPTAKASVVYIGAEGGSSLHIRRAAAEMHAGEVGHMFVVQERPSLDTADGAAVLRGILQALTFVLADDSDANFNKAYDAYEDTDALYRRGENGVLCIIDTYSQSSGGDDKTNVAAYIKNLRDMIEEAEEHSSAPLSFLVIDHATKGGDSYMGSVAKLNDVDSQIEVVRAAGSMRTTLHQHKTKDGVESAPVEVELVPFVLEGYTDAYGDPISTLVAQDGRMAARMAEIAGGKAAVLLALLRREGGAAVEARLRELFAADPSNTGIKSDSVMRSYRRCRDELLEMGAIREDGDTLEMADK